MKGVVVINGPQMGITLHSLPQVYLAMSGDIFDWDSSKRATGVWEKTRDAAKQPTGRKRNHHNKESLSPKCQYYQG